MINFNNSHWFIPVSHFYIYVLVTISAHGSGMQIDDLAPFKINLSPVLYNGKIP